MTSSFCEKCNSEVKYNGQYDTYYCELCNEWLESKCDDPTCDFCSNRPEKPTLADRAVNTSTIDQ